MENIEFNEYGAPRCSIIKPNAVAPKCPQAVIPIVTVENKSGIKKLSGCFVHVVNINTTFYIDDKRRITIVWAGPVEVENYDYETNELGLRSQVAYDLGTNKAIYFTKTGAYRIIEMGV